MTELTKPDDCNTMDELRHQIDKLDIKIVGLLAHRSDFIDRATELKNLNGMPARIPERIESVVSNARNAAQELELDADLVEKLWRILIDWSIQREAEIIREEYNLPMPRLISIEEDENGFDRVGLRLRLAAEVHRESLPLVDQIQEL